MYCAVIRELRVEEKQHVQVYAYTSERAACLASYFRRTERVLHSRSDDEVKPEEWVKLEMV